jgi:N6-L-threonylcarbamoyladenine synthase
VILGVETSCDDTCAAVVGADGQIHSNVIASQGLLHAKYGGVVPEIASRHHLELLDATIDDALEKAGVSLRDDIDQIAVTRTPGLIGALLVGLSAAKATAAALELPLTPVDHLHGHVVASTLGDNPIEPPFLCLVASGGHTFVARVDEPSSYTVLGQTLDDAAGEAFDKGARLLGLGYPGGPALDKLAQTGDATAFDFPRSKPGSGLDFSFSGLKTSLLYKVKELGPDEAEARKPDLAAAYQRAIVDSLVTRVEQALKQTGLTKVAIGGGVAANSWLREAIKDLEHAGEVHVPPRELCTDNAAMIAGAARFTPALPYPEYLALDASPRALAATS